MEPIWKILDYNEMNCPPPEAEAGADPQSSPAQPETSNSEILVSRDIDRFDLIIISGAVMMLIGLFMDLYTLSFASVSMILTPEKGYSHFDLDFAFLKDWGAIEFGLHWSGAVLPLVMLFIFPSLAILGVFYCRIRHLRIRHLWKLLSLFSVSALTANFLYILVILQHNSYNSYFIMPQTGWALALIGALTIGIGGRREAPSDTASAPGMPVGLLIVLSGAAMLLIALTLDWYSLYSDDGYWYGPADFGFWVRFPKFSLPFIAVAVLVSYSAIYAQATGRRFKRLWIGLGILAALILIANLIAMMRWGWVADEYYALPRAGWFLALAGAAAIGLGGWIMKSGVKQGNSRKV